MQPDLSILEALLHCPYKAWRLSREGVIPPTENPGKCYSPVALNAWQISISGKISPGPSNKVNKQAEQLLADAEQVLNLSKPPAFYKITHCSECGFKHDCYNRLKERDCVSLLAGMTPKAMAKYHSKGITTITQLSYLFKPRRRRAPQPQNSYLCELKALAIREQKTFVIASPEFNDGPATIFIDFEGTSNDNHIYLLGALVIENGKPDEAFAFWSERKEQDESNFKKLFDLLHHYPDAGIYHYGSYEAKALKQAVKKWPKTLKNWPAIEKRMVNLLGCLRTHVYPPTYGNGLKELGAFLGFRWDDPNADGFLSMEWRRQWEATALQDWKDKLIRYNQDDCRALYQVQQWFCHLAADAMPENVQQVAQMKKHSPYRLQNNLDYGEDFQFISKAAYFDYQRNKIYWRSELKKQSPAGSEIRSRPKPGQGLIAWQPKKVNEVIIVPPLRKCRKCGHTKLYQSHKYVSAVKQTDLKFTASGVRQHVTEYRNGSAKCAKCFTKTRNQRLRIMHYGDNLFALAINYYVFYHYASTREVGFLQELLRDYQGIIISDFYPGYETLNVTSQKCLIHLIRDLNDDLFKNQFNEEYKNLVSAFSKLLRMIIETIDNHGLKKKFLAKHIKDTEGFYREFIARDYKSELGLKYAKRFKKHWQQLWTFLRHDNVPWNNNNAEAAVKAFAHHRRGVKGQMHVRGIRDYLQMLTVAQTCRYRNISFLDLLRKKKGIWENVPHEALPGFLPFEQAKLYIHRLGFERQAQWNEWKRQGSRPAFIPSNPQLTYFNKGWLDWHDWIGFDFLPFEKARTLVRKLRLRNRKEYTAWLASGKRPKNIPYSPEKEYKYTGWVDFNDWLGTAK